MRHARSPSRPTVPATSPRAASVLSMPPNACAKNMRRGAQYGSCHAERQLQVVIPTSHVSPIRVSPSRPTKSTPRLPPRFPARRPARRRQSRRISERTPHARGYRQDWQHSGHPGAAARWPPFTGFPIHATPTRRPGSHPLTRCSMHSLTWDQAPNPRNTQSPSDPLTAWRSTSAMPTAACG